MPQHTAGLEEDCPFDPNNTEVALSEESAEAVDAEAFVEYASRLYQYLLVSNGWGREVGGLPV